MNELRSTLFRLLGIVLLLAIGFSGTALAQGVQTAELTGTVKSSDGQALPGVTVSLRSPSLQGVRTTTTDANGAYLVKGLAPGAYTITFESPGMTTVNRTATVGVGAAATVDASLSIAKVEESVTVTAEIAPVLTTSQGVQEFPQKVIDTLATNRGLDDIADLAPGTTFNGVNGQITINGAVAFDNVFLIDGVDVADNVFGNPENSLFIADAVEETQVLTSGISAEYGRFSGGVINAVTKRGGNIFSGTFRTNLSNPKWTANTPLETKNGIKHKDALQKSFEATFGGPIVKDRLWFFVAGLKSNTDTPTTLNETGIAYDNTVDDKRIEGKLTGTITPNHTLQVAYTHRSLGTVQTALNNALETQTIVHPQFPGSVLVASYNGVLSSNFFAEAQFSQKQSHTTNFGGTDTLLQHSPFVTQGVTVPGGLNYHAPYFDATDPENRDNRQITAALSYFLSSAGFGKHDLKAGFENFRDTHTGGNSQSPTSFVFFADYLTNPDGTPVLDANNNVTPTWVPGISNYANWLAQRGGRIDISTNSLYLNDKWNLNNHWTFNVGGRYEKARSEATGGLVGVDTHSFVPRLAASFDPKGDGRFKLDATYAHYSGKFNTTLFGNNTNVSNPSLIYAIYNGPTGAGFDFAPGLDLNNYTIVFASSPTGNVKFLPNLSSPIIKEFTLGAGGSFGSTGYAKVIYTWRKYTNFVQDLVNHAGGTSDVVLNGLNVGVFDNHVWTNSNLPDRRYQGIQLQTGYRITDRWNFTGNYTIQIKNDGNYEGENANQPALTSAVGQYPEVFPGNRTFPDGHLAIFQRHKVRAWMTYDLGLGRAGDLNVGVLWRYDSGLTDSLVAASVPLTPIQQALAVGYASPPPTQNVFFGPRGSVQFPGAHQFDIALTYNIPIYKSLKPYVKFDARNAFNNVGVIRFNDTIQVDPTSPVDSFGLPTGFIKGARFGQPTQDVHFVVPRTISFVLGFRF
jgi:outer membrane receptor for ferrienterochelin and colicin